MLVDLSFLIRKNNSEPMDFEHSRLDGYKGAKFVAEKSGIKPSDFPNNEFLTLDTVKLTTHMGTHIDAPVHFGHDLYNKKQKSVSDLPISWFYGDGVKLDFSKFPKKTNIERKDIEKKIREEKVKIKKGNIVLIQTDMDKIFGKKEYFTDNPGMSAEATKYLIDLGVKVIGIDAYGFDRSFNVMLEEFKKTNNKDILWPSHMLGRKYEYVQIERLCNLDKLPLSGFKISAFPIKLDDGDASWTRAVAIINN